MGVVLDMHGVVTREPREPRTPPPAAILRQAHQHIAEAWALKAESASIKRRYEERQKQIEVLLAGMERA
jgi:hypothetical protein